MPHDSTGPFKGERCTFMMSDRSICGEPASHKVGDEMPRYERAGNALAEFALNARHNLTAYLCCVHFTTVMGVYSYCFGGEPAVIKPDPVKDQQLADAMDGIMGWQGGTSAVAHMGERHG